MREREREMERERERENCFQNLLEKQIHSNQISKIFSLFSTGISTHTNNTSRENDSSLFPWGSHDRKIGHCLYRKKKSRKKSECELISNIHRYVLLAFERLVLRYSDSEKRKEKKGKDCLRVSYSYTLKLPRPMAIYISLKSPVV